MTSTFIEYPEAPTGPEFDAGSHEAFLRYDDVVQDGRLRLEAAWRSTGRALRQKPEVACILDGLPRDVTTVMSRSVMEATDARLVVRTKVRTETRYRFEHTRNAAGEVDRLLFSTWLVVHAGIKGGGEAVAGRAHGQRVFTRHGAPPGKHLVPHLPVFGETGHAPHVATWEPATSLLEVPAGAEPLEAEPALDPGRIVFGLSHTDLNQHVNFLMYHRAAEAAALGRFADLGLGARWGARQVAVGYRKPSFSGDVVRFALRAFRLGDALGVIGALVEPTDGPPSRRTFRDFGAARVCVRMLFER